MYHHTAVRLQSDTALGGKVAVDQLPGGIP